MLKLVKISGLVLAMSSVLLSVVGGLAVVGWADPVTTWTAVGAIASVCASTVGGVAKVGDLVRSTQGGWMRLAPTHCPAGHEFVPGRMIVGYRPCATHSGHRTWTCPCGGTIAAPEIGAACDVQGPGAVREL